MNAPMPDRFWAKVDQSAGPDACWPWIAGRDSKGYGSFRVNGRQVGSHRIALESKLGRPLGPGEQARHACDNPPCCRPDHLWLGTAAENAQDAKAKGRLRSWASDPSGRPGGSTGLTRPIYRLRSRGRIEVLTARGNWQRKALIPPNGIQVADAPLTESELRWLHGDR